MKSSLIVLFTVLIASTAYADKQTPTQRALKDFAEAVCNRDFVTQAVCESRMNSYLKGREAPVDEQALAAAKLEISQKLCVGDSGAADDCWRNVSRRFNDERKKIEKQGGEDRLKLAESVARTIGSCTEEKRFRRDNLHADCVREKIAGLQAQVSAGTSTTPFLEGTDTAALGAASHAVISTAAEAPTYKAASGNGTMGTPPLPCTAGTDRGAEIKLGDDSPLGEGAHLIVYPSAITIWSGPKDTRTFSNSKAGWTVVKGNREKGSVGNLIDGWPGKLLDGKITIEYKRDSLIIRRTDSTPVVVTTVKLPQEQSGDMIRNQVEISTAAGAPLGRFTSQISVADHTAGTRTAVSGFEAIPIKDERKRAQETFYRASLERMLSGPAATASLGPSNEVVRSGCSTGTTNLAFAPAGGIGTAGTPTAAGIGGAGTPTAEVPR